jgi:hypothetical protein
MAAAGDDVLIGIPHAGRKTRKRVLNPAKREDRFSAGTKRQKHRSSRRKKKQQERLEWQV